MDGRIDRYTIREVQSREDREMCTCMDGSRSDAVHFRQVLPYLPVSGSGREQFHTSVQGCSGFAPPDGSVQLLPVQLVPLLSLRSPVR